MLGQIGTIRYEGLKGFDRLSRSRAAIYTELAKIKGKPGLQRTGDALINISISIRLHRFFCTPEDEINKLEAYRASGEIVPFILGTGEYIGDFVVAEVIDEFVTTDAVGALIESIVSLTLLEYYDEDKLATKQSAALDNANAIVNDNIKPLRLITAQKPSEAGDIANDVKSVKTSGKKVNKWIAEIDKAPSRASFYYSKMQDELSAVQKKVSAITTKINNAAAIAEKVPNLLNVVSSLGNMTATFQSTFPPTSLTDVKASNSAFQTAIGNTDKESMRLNALLATKQL